MKKLHTIFSVAAILFSFQTAALADYAIIVDAGSSGSRLHLFEYNKAANIPVINDVFSISTKPGLSAFASHPEDAGTSLKTLLDAATQKLQEAHVSADQVTISVLATAGMRLVPTATQDLIYTNVKSYLASHYTFKVANIQTIPGKMEGLFGWLDVNYLEQNFQRHLPTAGAIDMGGASTQITFATQNASKAEDEINITLDRQNYTIFTKSFLGLGQDQARATMNKGAAAYTCYPSNFPLNASTLGQFNFSSCQHLYADVLAQYHLTEALIMPEKSQKFIAFSGVFYAYNFLGAATNPDAAYLESKIQTICTRAWNQLQQDYPKIPITYLASYCANSTYIDDLLYGTYGINGSQLKVANKIADREIDWTLGALLYTLVSSPTLNEST